MITLRTRYIVIDDPTDRRFQRYLAARPAEDGDGHLVTLWAATPSGADLLSLDEARTVATQLSRRGYPEATVALAPLRVLRDAATL